MRLLQAWQVWVTPGAGPRPSRTRISLTSCHLSATPHSLTLSGKNARVRRVGSAWRRQLLPRCCVLHRMDALAGRRRCCCINGLSPQLNKSLFCLQEFVTVFEKHFFLLLLLLLLISPNDLVTRRHSQNSKRQNIPSAPLGLALKVSTFSKMSFKKKKRKKVKRKETDLI